MLEYSLVPKFSNLTIVKCTVEVARDVPQLLRIDSQGSPLQNTVTGVNCLSLCIN
jgi:hypothetical protein